MDKATDTVGGSLAASAGGSLLSGAIGGGGGSSSSTAYQPYIMSGPTQQAANSAAAAQIGAAQIAAQAATQNTTSAINALMQQYGTALTYANPAINTGNQAAAQYNYMLGLPAVAPGAAPTAPTMGKPTDISSQQIQQYILQNSQALGNPNDPTKYSTNPNGKGNYQYTGAGAYNNQDAWKAYDQNDPNAQSAKVGAGDYGTLSGLYADPTLQASVTSELQKQQQPLLQQQFDQANTTYQQQLDQYNKQKAVYDQYSAKGTPTGNDVANVVNNLPGFQFEQKQGINAIQNAASATGMLNSGNLLQGLNEYGQGISQKYYQNYLTNLNSLSTAGNQASGTAAAGANQLGANVAGAYANQGSTRANAALAAGQAMASSYLSPVSNQQVIQTPTQSGSTSTQGGKGILGSIF